jgi:RNA polymerase sigma-70 factor (ECF subfamily)
MAQAARGSEAAFTEIVERHHGRLLRTFRLLGAGGDEARDLAQECFLRLLRAAPRWQPRARFSTFLFTVAKRLASDARGRAWVRRRVPLEAEPMGDCDASSAVEARELRERVAEALAGLAAPDREALVWSEIGGLTYREIAEIHGVPEGTVASRKHRAVRQVRERWKGELP